MQAAVAFLLAVVAPSLILSGGTFEILGAKIFKSLTDQPDRQDRLTPTGRESQRKGFFDSMLLLGNVTRLFKDFPIFCDIAILSLVHFFLKNITQ
jgi:fucose 4-O-acetylase-like acetyltransferase